MNNLIQGIPEHAYHVPENVMDEAIQKNQGDSYPEKRLSREEYIRFSDSILDRDLGDLISRTVGKSHKMKKRVATGEKVF